MALSPVEGSQRKPRSRESGGLPSRKFSELPTVSCCGSVDACSGIIKGSRSSTVPELDAGSSVVLAVTLPMSFQLKFPVSEGKGVSLLSSSLLPK